MSQVTDLDELESNSAKESRLRIAGFTTECKTFIKEKDAKAFYHKCRKFMKHRLVDIVFPEEHELYTLRCNHGRDVKTLFEDLTSEYSEHTVYLIAAIGSLAIHNLSKSASDHYLFQWANWDDRDQQGKRGCLDGKEINWLCILSKNNPDHHCNKRSSNDKCADCQMATVNIADRVTVLLDFQGMKSSWIPNMIL